MANDLVKEIYVSDACGSKASINEKTAVVDFK